MNAGNLRMMATKTLNLLGAAALALVAVPALAQYHSDGYTFLKAVRARDGATVEPMVTRPNAAVINAREASSGEGALHILVRGRDLTWLSFMLGRGARPDLQSNDGTTALGLAAQLGWREGAELLLRQGADPNLANSRGETPLILAVQRRDLPMARLLLSRRADPDQTDNVAGYSARDYARRDPRAAPILREFERER